MPDIGSSFNPISQPFKHPDEPPAISEQKESVQPETATPADDFDVPLETMSLQEFLAIQAGVAHPTDSLQEASIDQGKAEDTQLIDDDAPPLNKKEKTKFRAVLETGEKIVSVARDATSRVQSHARSGHEKHIAKGASTLVELFNIPVEAGRFAQTTETLKEARETLKLKKQIATELLESPPSKERDTQYLLIEREIDELKGKIDKLKKQKLKSTVGVAKSGVKSATGIATIVSTVQNQADKAKIASSFRSTGLQAVNLASKVAVLVDQGKKYTQLKEELEEVKTILETLRTSGQESTEIFLANERRIETLEKDILGLRESLVENSIIGAGNLFETLGAVADTLLELGPHIGLTADTATQVLSTVSTAVPIATGIIGIVLNGRQIADNVSTDTSLTVEIEKLRRKIPKTPQPLHDILIMKLKNLEFQREENIISVIQNTFTLYSGALGTTASAIALVGVTGVVGVVGATAGVGASVVAGAAIAIGGGYYIYKNRLYMSARARSTIHQTQQKILTTQLQVTEYFGSSKQRSVQKTVSTLAEQKIKTRKQKHEVQDKFSRKIEPLLDVLHTKNNALKVLTDMKSSLEEQRNSIDNQRYASDFQQIQEHIHHLQTDIIPLQAEIKKLNSKIEKLTQSAIDKASGKLESEEKAQEAIAKQLEKINESNLKIIRLREQKQLEHEKGKLLKDNLENHTISASMSECSPAEVALFKEDLRQTLEDPEQADVVRRFLETQSIEINEDDLLEGCLSYLVKKLET
jgi:DNA repair exonuclease SbcCD ATPase subunit